MAAESKNAQAPDAPSAFPVRVGRSDLHGRGVFVVRTVDANEYLCFFDGYGKTDAKKPTGLEARYSIGDVVGYIVPRTPGGCGQIANDAARPSFDDFPEAASLEAQVASVADSIAAYVHSMRRCNALVWATDHHARSLVAFRDILFGDEVLIHYGVEYWYGMISDGAHSDSLVRALGIFLSAFRAARGAIDESKFMTAKRRAGLAKAEKAEAAIVQFFFVETVACVVAKSQSAGWIRATATMPTLEDVRNIRKTGALLSFVSETSKDDVAHMDRIAAAAWKDVVPQFKIM